MTIVVVGKNSMMGREMQKHYSEPDWLFLSHDEAFADTAWGKKARCVINFALSPAMRTAEYNPAEDIDLRLAQTIPADTHYIMMSSRTVYGPAPADGCLKEEHKPNPQTIYARNKLETESRLQDMHGDHLTILRGANVFGYEFGRRSFLGMALGNLKAKNEIIFDMNPLVKRDFISAQNVSRALGIMSTKPQNGIFNLGCGYGTACGEVAAWIIEGYGQGSVSSTSDEMRDAFYLDMSKAEAAFNLPAITPDTLKAECVACGQQLRSQT